MSLIMTPSALAANLDALGDRNADVVEEIRAAAEPDDLRFAESGQTALTGTLDGTSLASRHRPLDEAARLADSVDLVENAVVVVLGFGLGYHVAALARRMGKRGLIVVFEPDIRLLRGAFDRIDHSEWLRESIVVFVTSEDDRGELGRKLAGAEAMLGQGVALVEHPASRARLAEPAAVFGRVFADFVTTAKITLTTTLVRSIDTFRNLLRNTREYVGGSGVADLEGAAKGRLAVTVSAGPSLSRNVRLLAQPGVRDRCVIIAVQTALKPLLEAGVRPHFVTALDFHEISRRFYEGLSADDVAGVTLVADPKAHPAILASFPGPVRCCASPILDRMLGSQRRDMGVLPAGATVAHLALYLAEWLGCDPIAMIGQDLGFPDGLYYAPGTAIHDVWASELNPFNTIAMMEWQRIVRMRVHLHRTTDVHGKSIYTDAQMATYLQQFERDFLRLSEKNVTVIDATEGGVAKQHTTRRPLHEVLETHATEPLPAWPAASTTIDRDRLASVETRLQELQRDVVALRATARRTAAVLRRMLSEQDDAARMTRNFEKVERYRRQVDDKLDAFELLQFLNQLGSFKRLRADRRLEMQTDLDPRERQRAQLDRDLENVVWIADAAAEMIAQLGVARRRLRGQAIPERPRPVQAVSPAGGNEPRTARGSSIRRIAAIVPLDAARGGLGLPRVLDEPLGDRSVLQATLERLGASRALDSIILLAPDGLDVERLFDPRRIGRPVEIERVGGSPFGATHRAIAVARQWADTCWRGGPGNTCVYDEILCAKAMHDAVQRRGLGGVVLVGADWPFVAARGERGCDALIERHRENPEGHRLVFNQAPPGLGGCLLDATILAELAVAGTRSTIGQLLGYRPSAPQEDPIGKDGNVQIAHDIRHALVRATFDSPRQQRILRHALADRDPSTVDDETLIPALVAATEATADAGPRHLLIELTTERRDDGVVARHPFGRVARPPMTTDLARRIFEGLATLELGDCLVTFGGVGDPLLHPDFDAMIRLARESGAQAVHVRTALRVDDAVIDRLLAAAPDVVSVDLHADCEATYERMMGASTGHHDFRSVLESLKRLLHDRRANDDDGFPLPWIVPRLQRRVESYEDIDTFFDRWMHMIGAALIESPPPFERSATWPGDSLTDPGSPPRVARRELLQRMTIQSDGGVPTSELDLPGAQIAARLDSATLLEAWTRLLARRREWLTTLDPSAPELRILTP